MVDPQELVLVETSSPEGTTQLIYKTWREYPRDASGRYTSEEALLTTERISLRALSPQGERGKQLDLREQRNERGEHPLRKVSARLARSPSHDRIAYQVGTQPWELLFVLGPDIWIQAPRRALADEPGDWSSAPTALSVFMQVYEKPREQLDFQTREQLLSYLLEHGSEAQQLRLLEEVLRASGASALQWQGAMEKLPPARRERFVKQVTPTLISADAPLAYVMHLARWVELMDPAYEALIWSAPERLLGDREFETWGSASVALYLHAALQEEPARAGALAARILERRQDLFTVSQPGRRLRLALLSVLGTSRTKSAMTPRLLPADPCAPGAGLFKPGGSRYSARELEEVIAAEVAVRFQAEAAHVRADQDAQFVLGAMMMAGQEVPARFLKPCAVPGE